MLFLFRTFFFIMCPPVCPFKAKKSPWWELQPELIFFHFTSAKLLHFDVVLFLKLHYWCELARQGIWVCVCFVKHYTVAVCIYIWHQSRSAAHSWTKSCVSWPWFSEELLLEVLRNMWEPSHVTLFLCGLCRQHDGMGCSGYTFKLVFIHHSLCFCTLDICIWWLLP